MYMPISTANPTMVGQIGCAGWLTTQKDIEEIYFFVDFDIMLGGMLMIFNGVLHKSGHKNHCVSALSDARFE